MNKKKQRSEYLKRQQELVDAANDNGGKDNISVILIEPLA